MLSTDPCIHIYCTVYTLIGNVAYHVVSHRAFINYIQVCRWIWGRFGQFCVNAHEDVSFATRQNRFAQSVSDHSNLGHKNEEMWSMKNHMVIGSVFDPWNADIIECKKDGWRISTSTIEKWSQNILSIAVFILWKWCHLEPESAK